MKEDVTEYNDESDEWIEWNIERYYDLSYEKKENVIDI